MMFGNESEWEDQSTPQQDVRSETVAKDIYMCMSMMIRCGMNVNKGG